VENLCASEYEGGLKIEDGAGSGGRPSIKRYTWAERENWVREILLNRSDYVMDQRLKTYLLSSQSAASGEYQLPISSHSKIWLLNDQSVVSLPPDGPLLPLRD
jgi:hypothetical protein